MLADSLSAACKKVRVAHARGFRPDTGTPGTRPRGRGPRGQLQQVLAVERALRPRSLRSPRGPPGPAPACSCRMPFGPMMAWTSPGFTVRLMPLRISLSLNSRVQILDFKQCRFRSGSVIRSADAAFQAHAQQLLRFHRELHRQLPEHFLAEAVHDHVHRVLVEMPRWLQ